MIEYNKIYNEDCTISIDRMDEETIDLTICSPPYNVNLGSKTKFKYDIYNDNIEHKDYLNWLESIFQNIYKKTKIGGRCVINIGDAKNGKINTHSDIIQFMKKIGWGVLSIIIWDKGTTNCRTAWGVLYVSIISIFSNTI